MVSEKMFNSVEWLFWLLTKQIKNKTAFQLDARHPLYQSYVFQWPLLHVRTGGGSSSSEQICRGLQWWPPDTSTRRDGGRCHVWCLCLEGGRSPRSPRSDFWGPTNLMMQSVPSRCEEADACENITFPQIRLKVVVNIAHVWILFFIQCERHLISEILSLHPVTDG